LKDVAAVFILISRKFGWLPCFCYYLLRFFQSLQDFQFLLYCLLLNKRIFTSFAGLPNFSLKYSSRVLLDRLLIPMELIFKSEAVDLFAWFAWFSLLMMNWDENSSSWLLEVLLGIWAILFLTIS
jgi:hypothetical protein